jgi:hypothetical protein
MINQRRLHMCKLDAEQQEHQYSFLIRRKVDNVEILSIKENSKLISTRGRNDNKNLNKRIIGITGEGEEDGLPIYCITIRDDKGTKSGNKDTKNNEAEVFVLRNRLDSNVPVKVLANSPSNSSYILKLCYIDKEQKEFTYSFKIHLYKNEDLVEAAIDFGSEASQVRLNRDDWNMDIVHEFKKLYKISESDKTEFWQGKEKDDLFKSIFFINTQPSGNNYNYADPPNCHKEQSIIHTLTAIKAEGDIYKTMKILPNLKLMTLINNDVIDWDRIVFQDGKDNPFERYLKETTMSSHQFKAGSLRFILGYFLYAILENRLSTNTTKAQFLKLVVLVPNVYNQEKVCEIVTGLYEDFETIRANTKYSQYMGIEVQTISESDASFLGIRAKQITENRQRNAPKKYFLSIDAGKGTTDFSILRQHDNYSEFDSVYRGGVAASGHVLTYAFYEAIRDMLNGMGIKINDKLKSANECMANRSLLLNFVEYLEKMKHGYNTIKQHKGTIAQENRLPANPDLSQINQFCSEVLTKKIKIPKIETIVDGKIKELVNLIFNSIEVSKINTFEQIMLTGRAFLFDPFRESFIEQMIKKKWVKSKDDIIYYEGKQSKTLCLYNIFSTDASVKINQNSDLICEPIFEKNEASKSSLLKWRKCGKARIAWGTDSLYNGTRIPSGCYIGTLGEYKYEINISTSKQIYFTGDGFIVQEDSSCSNLEAFGRLTNEQEYYKQTLFPFHPKSIPDVKYEEDYINRQKEQDQDLDKVLICSRDKRTN